jgi:hypothetical protein
MLFVERDRPDWQRAAPVILMRAAILVAMGITIGVVLILTGR